MPARVSVVMPVYNGERFLAEAIASVLGQTFADFELNIVDDGSTDGSRAIIEEYAHRDSRIVPVLLRDNQGKASARNRGIERASGQYIAAMDCDDICLPDRLRRQVNFLDTFHKIGAIGTNTCTIDQESRLQNASTYRTEHTQILFGLFFSISVAHPAIMIRRELLVQAGGYEEGRRICGDTELWTRLIQKTRFANLPDVLMLYRRHSQATSVKDRERQRAEGAAVRRNALERLWGDMPAATADLFTRVWLRETNFRRAERALLRAEMTRLIDSFVDAGWVEADERPLLQSAMASELQRIKPRRRHFWKRLI